MNLTDVDDKTIRGSRAAHLPLREFTAPFKEAFFQDLDTLQIKRANAFPAATEERFIEAMIAMIEKLMARDLAYQADDKSVYFRINRFPELRPSGAFRSRGIAFDRPGKNRRIR